MTHNKHTAQRDARCHIQVGAACLQSTIKAHSLILLLLSALLLVVSVFGCEDPNVDSQGRERPFDSFTAAPSSVRVEGVPSVSVQSPHPSTLLVHRSVPLPASGVPQHAMLPRIPGMLAPSLASLVVGDEPPEELGEISDCRACHAQITKEWSKSAHAFSSFHNPFYRFSVERFRDRIGHEQSQHCAGCHDLSLAFEGAMLAPIDPADTRSEEGVTCRACHSITAATFEGNGSYTLTSAPVPLPRKGDPDSLKAHSERLAPAVLKSNALCVSCHRGFLGPATGNPSHVIGLSEPGQWARSAQAGSGVERVDDLIEKKNCVSCHMPLIEKDGKSWRTHDFLAGHTALAAAGGGGARLEAVQGFLKGVASIDIAAITLPGPRSAPIFPPEAATPQPGDRILLDIVIRNLTVGHRFPGSTRDLQDTWVELEIFDKHKNLIAEAGTRHAEEDDPTAHRLLAVQLDAAGVPVQLHDVERFNAVLVDHTISARDAAVIQYAFTLPESLSPEDFPLHARARLRHRRHPKDFSAAVCAESKTPRGQAFKDFQIHRGILKTALDPCVEMPITEISDVEVSIGDPIPPQGAPPLWRRRQEHAIGWLHSLQERVGVARPSLIAALEEVTALKDARGQAMVLSLLAQLEVRQGRTQDALQWVSQAEKILPNDASLHFIRGEAFSSVWRWCEAVSAYRAALDAAPPGDDRVWSQLAKSTASCGDQRGALEAAQAGLLTRPHHTQLLLTQALSLRRLKAPKDLEASARKAYLDSRPNDQGTTLRITCTQNTEGCDKLRLPIPLFEMRLSPQ